MTPIDAAQRAGWFFWLGSWFCGDLSAILALEAPPVWRGTARDLCLAQGIAFGGGSAVTFEPEQVANVVDDAGNTDVPIVFRLPVLGGDWIYYLDGFEAAAREAKAALERLP